MYRLTDKQQDKIKHYNLTSEEQQKMYEAMDGIKSLIDLCGDDAGRNGLEETPFRFTKAMLEYTEGYRENPKEHLKKTFDVEHDQLVIVKDIEFNSLCEHHFAPFYGKMHIGYIPDGKITGLSKFGRLADGYAKRFQVQERLTNQIADAIEEVLQPKGAMVVVEAKHMCMCGRGVKKKEANTVTSAVKGVFMTEAQARNEFLSLIKD